MFGSQCAQRPWPSRWAPLGTPQLTPGEEHGVQPQAGSALQAGGQLREVVAVEVEDDPQRLPTALNVVEDAGVCGRTRQGGGSPPRPEGSPAPPSPGQLHPCLHTPRWLSGASLFSPPQRSSLRMPSYLQRGIPGLPCLPTPEHWSAHEAAELIQGVDGAYQLQGGSAHTRRSAEAPTRPSCPVQPCCCSFLLAHLSRGYSPVNLP